MQNSFDWSPNIKASEHFSITESFPQSEKRGPWDIQLSEVKYLILECGPATKENVGAQGKRCILCEKQAERI